MTDRMVFSQRIRLPYRYTAGPAHRAVLSGLARGVLTGCRCEPCGIVLAPARPFCPRCSEPTGELVELPDTGTVQGWTRVHRDGAAVTYGLVRLDGADTDLLHLLSVPAESLAKGLRVAAVWAGERVGEITDIRYFALLDPNQTFD